MAPNYNIAVVQLYPKPLAIEENYNKAVSFIRSAASQGCHLAVLPEYHLTSWVPDDPSFISLCAQYQKYLDGYCALAKELSICIVPGTIVEKVDENLLNVATFISNTGEILHKYTKKNLWHPERPHLTASSISDPHVAFDTPLGKVGLLICWDLAFPEAFRALIKSGAHTIIIPTFWSHSDCTPAGLTHNPLSEKLFLQSTLVARAFENTCCVVFCNAGGPSIDGDTAKAGSSTDVDAPNYLGLSQIAVPFKGPLFELGASEEMRIAEVDMAILADAEDNYKVRYDLGREDWHYGYTHATPTEGEGTDD